MDKVILKYLLTPTDTQKVSLPKGAEILSVQSQFNDIDNKTDVVLWALVDPTVEKEERVIEMFGTGNPIAYDMGVTRKYISTFQIPTIGFVGHVFEYTGV